MISAKKSLEFFSAVRLGDAKKLNKILKGRSLKSLLTRKIKRNYNKIKDTLESSVEHLSKKSTYREIACELAIKSNQFDILKYLITPKYHLNSILKLLMKYSKDKDISKLIKELVENGADMNATLNKAVLLNDADMVDYIAKNNWEYIDKFKNEIDSYDILQLAVKSGSLKILQLLFSSSYIEKTKVIFHRETSPLLSYAAKVGDTQLIDYLGKIFKYDQYDTKNNLTVPFLPLGLSDFYADELKPKGIALLLEYYQNKKIQPNKDPKVFFSLGYENLVHAIKLFIDSSETSLTLLFANSNNNREMGGHRNVYQIEKYCDSYYVILIDSYYTERSNCDGDFDELITLINQQISDSADKFVFCKNTTNQQTDGENCTHFSLKNVSKLLTTDCLAKEIEDKHIIKESTYRNRDIIYYRLPARFMNVAQSPDRLKAYIETNDAENLKKVRINKDKKPESLEQYVYHKRNKYGIKTPEKILNRNYSSDHRVSDEPKYIKKNKTIYYFANKHKNHIVPTLFNNKTQQELRFVVKSRDASYLAIDPKTKELDNNDKLMAKTLAENENGSSARKKRKLR